MALPQPARPAVLGIGQAVATTRTTTTAITTAAVTGTTTIPRATPIEADDQPENAALI